jgi:hypothetical protein
MFHNAHTNESLEMLDFKLCIVAGKNFNALLMGLSPNSFVVCA